MFHKEEMLAFVDLNDKTSAVHRRCVKPVSFQLFVQFGTNDIKYDHGNKTINENKQLNRKILMNKTDMKFPSGRDQNSYACCMFLLTYNCGSVKSLKIYLFE